MKINQEVYPISMSYERSTSERYNFLFFICIPGSYQIKGQAFLLVQPQRTHENTPASTVYCIPVKLHNCSFILNCNHLLANEKTQKTFISNERDTQEAFSSIMIVVHPRSSAERINENSAGPHNSTQTQIIITNIEFPEDKL